MFERRLKIFLAVLAVFTFVLLVRAAQVQVVQSDEWAKAASESMRRSQLIETIRGSIVDRNGKTLAIDRPCVDVCIDYRALTEPPNEKWVLLKAGQRAKLRKGEEWDRLPRSKRNELAAAEVESIKQDLRAMWVDLPKLGLKSADEIEETRQAIVNRVAMRQRIAWYNSYRKAMKLEEDRQQEAFWRRWLVEGVKGDNAAPENFAVTVEEESQSHVIIRAVDVATQNYLGKNADRFPGLELRASTHRTYPFGSAACHVMGRVSRVTREDVTNPAAPKEETRQYLPNDEIGRGGIEQLCEAVLRGTKGKVEKVPGQAGELSHLEPVAGKDVRLTIDIQLQQKIEAAFRSVDIWDSKDNQITSKDLHGAAVVIDVPTGEVLALTSFPTFDLNTFEEYFTRLADDDLNHPLLNRATMAQLQPGSTMKPIVGLSAISEGKITPETVVECTGYMMKQGGGRWPWGRCWVASKFAGHPDVPSVAHHPIPVPHPTGFLTFADALERSCNIYFETLADWMGLELLSDWYEKFGLGRPTGIGIAEARGRLPRSYTGPASALRQKIWFSGIGQDPVAATPIQMANAAATIARGGIWARPRLIPIAETDRLGIKLPRLKPAPRKDAETDLDGDGKPDQVPADFPDSYDMKLSLTGLAAAREGMQRVVYGAAGTGKGVARHAPALEGLRICGKTGTAQAPTFSVKDRDPKTGQVLLTNGRPTFHPLVPGVTGNPNPIAPWYNGGDTGRELNHAWYMGFAPAEKPKIAFAVLVEYGGSGGGAAAAVAREVLTACVETGYLPGKAGKASVEKASAAKPSLEQSVTTAELLRSVR